MENETNKPLIRHNKEMVSMPISTYTFSRIIKVKNNEAVLLLYMAYCDIAMWQEKAKVWATTGFMCKRLGMNERKLIKAKKALIELGLIENIRTRNTKNTGFGKCYVKVNFLIKTTDNVLLQNVRSTQVQDKYFKSILTLSTNQQNEDDDKCTRAKRQRKVKAPINNDNQILLERIKQLEQELNQLKQPKELSLFPEQEKITPNHFDAFWGMYPNKTDKGKAFSAWCKLCTNKSKAKVLPTWETVRQAVKTQRKTERWADPQYIPAATTWINNMRWMDNPQMMTTRKTLAPPKEKRGFGYVGNKIEYKEPITM